MLREVVFVEPVVRSTGALERVRVSCERVGGGGVPRGRARTVIGFRKKGMEINYLYPRCEDTNAQHRNVQMPSLLVRKVIHS